MAEVAGGLYTACLLTLYHCPDHLPGHAPVVAQTCVCGLGVPAARFSGAVANKCVANHVKHCATLVRLFILFSDRLHPPPSSKPLSVTMRSPFPYTVLFLLLARPACCQTPSPSTYCQVVASGVALLSNFNVTNIDKILVNVQKKAVPFFAGLALIIGYSLGAQWTTCVQSGNSVRGVSDPPSETSFRSCNSREWESYSPPLANAKDDASCKPQAVRKREQGHGGQSQWNEA